MGLVSCLRSRCLGLGPRMSNNVRSWCRRYGQDLIKRHQTTDAERALTAFPAGSNGEFNLPKDLTTVLTRGKDYEVWDTTGKRYLDFSMGWGSVLVGHARGEVLEAVTRQAAKGSNFAYINDQELQLAEEIIKLSPAVEQLRFCASGTEATMYCERLARAFTDRTKVLKFEGAYHGGNDIGVTSLFPHRLREYPEPDPTSAGISQSVDNHVLVSPYNDLHQAEMFIDRYADDLAAVIMEPFHRCTSPKPGFLEGIRAVTQRNGVLLIFDEVVTGFRLAYGGAQEYYGVVPDLVAYGKALGGGYPIGVFGGREDIMGLVSEDRMGSDSRYVWTASSLGGNPISCSAALAALSIYRQKGSYEHLHSIGKYLRAGMAKCLADVNLPGHVIGDGPLAQILHCETLVHDYRQQKLQENAEQRRAVMIGLFRRGVFLNPMGTKFYLSLKHTEEACDQFLQRLEDALLEYKGQRT
ncbi:glutamate-1-semialdehyde 2,1-aminomutase-like [Patiria miniata]|uniref:Aspartate aminotransferase family protein n=1 Tax=Patiria miniata TaxID=46514 RepID=A0A914A5L8_PATMI|nr:glutamate-1-semialdehyde 2,1-aminomutase-like [Patiria miniata]